MNRTYKIYYDISSEKKFRSIDDSPDYINLDEVNSLLDLVKYSDDNILIYLNDIKLRIQIWGDDDSTKCVLELHDASKGVCFSKEFKKDYLKSNLEMNLNKYIDNPIESGFLGESF